MRHLLCLLLLFATAAVLRADLASAPSLAEARALAKREGRLVFLLFKSADCKHCRQFAREVLATEEFQAFARDHLAPMVYDVDAYDALPASERQLALSLEEKYGVEQMPAIVVFAPDGTRELLRTQGYRGTPAATIVAQLRSFLEKP